jgi:hypothetical protein
MSSNHKALFGLGIVKDVDRRQRREWNKFTQKGNLGFLPRTS